MTHFLGEISCLTPFFDELRSQLSLYAGTKIKLVVDRKGEPVWLDAEVTKEGKLGFAADSDYKKYYFNLQS